MGHNDPQNLRSSMNNAVIADIGNEFWKSTQQMRKKKEWTEDKMTE